jgi:hypothetical protein
MYFTALHCTALQVELPGIRDRLVAAWEEGRGGLEEGQVLTAVSIGRFLPLVKVEFDTTVQY